MATSSITANFYTDDPKAANAIVRALFAPIPPCSRKPGRVKFVDVCEDRDIDRFFSRRGSHA